MAQPAFTPNYVRHLIANNAGEVNQDIINTIRHRFNNQTLGRIIGNNNWLMPILAPQFPQHVPYIVGINLGALPQGSHLHGRVPLENEPIGIQEGSGFKKNKWINHVKAFSKKHNVSYFIALKEAKKTYKP